LLDRARVAAFRWLRTAFTISCSSQRARRAGCYARLLCSCAGNSWLICLGTARALPCCSRAFLGLLRIGRGALGASDETHKCARCCWSTSANRCPTKRRGCSEQHCRPTQSKGVDDELKVVTCAERPRLIDYVSNEQAWCRRFRHAAPRTGWEAVTAGRISAQRCGVPMAVPAGLLEACGMISRLEPTGTCWPSQPARGFVCHAVRIPYS